MKSLGTGAGREHSRRPFGSMQFVSRAVSGKLSRFQRESFSKFVPESFRWIDAMSRPGTKLQILERNVTEFAPNKALKLIS